MNTVSTWTIGLAGLVPEMIKVDAEFRAGGGGSVGEIEIVGLPDVLAEETRIRVRSALASLEYGCFKARVVVHTKPHVVLNADLAILVAIVSAIEASRGRLIVLDLTRYAFFGDVSFAGRIESVRGVLPRLFPKGGAPESLACVVVPYGNANDVALSPSAFPFNIRLAAHVRDVVETVLGESQGLDRCFVNPSSAEDNRGFAPEIPAAIRDEVELAVSRRESVLLVGPHNVGKLAIARAMAVRLIPKMDQDLAIEVTSIHQAAGVGQDGLITYAPFRAPHHTVSELGLLGGGVVPRPGEVSLAHGGVLYLDQVVEFRKAALDGLFGILSGHVSFARSSGVVSYPARPMIVASATPCACGHTVCSCSLGASHRARLAAIRTKFDRVIEVPSPAPAPSPSPRDVSEKASSS